MERKTHKENIGHVSGGVHKGKINKEGAKAVKRRRHRDKKDGYNRNRGTHKESMEDAMEQRNELERRTWRGRQGLQKGEDTGTEDTHRESTEDAQEATHENTSYI